MTAFSPLPPLPRRPGCPSPGPAAPRTWSAPRTRRRQTAARARPQSSGCAAPHTCFRSCQQHHICAGDSLNAGGHAWWACCQVIIGSLDASTRSAAEKSTNNVVQTMASCAWQRLHQFHAGTSLDTTCPKIPSMSADHVGQLWPLGLVVHRCNIRGLELTQEHRMLALELGAAHPPGSCHALSIWKQGK